MDGFHADDGGGQAVQAGGLMTVALVALLALVQLAPGVGQLLADRMSAAISGGAVLGDEDPNRTNAPPTSDVPAQPDALEPVVLPDRDRRPTSATGPDLATQPTTPRSVDGEPASRAPTAPAGVVDGGVRADAETSGAGASGAGSLDVGALEAGASRAAAPDGVNAPPPFVSMPPGRIRPAPGAGSYPARPLPPYPDIPLLTSGKWPEIHVYREGVAPTAGRGTSLTEATG